MIIQEMILSNLSTTVTGLPEYIKNEVANLSGRNGRGRLWVSNTLAPASIDNWDETKPLSAKASLCGGIVIRETDASVVKPLIEVNYGFLTNMDLDAWNQA